MSLTSNVLREGNKKISVKTNIMNESASWKEHPTGSSDDPGNYSDLSDHSETRKDGKSTIDSPTKTMAISLDDTAVSTVTPSFVEPKTETVEIEASCNGEDNQDEFETDVPSRIAPQRAISNISVLSLNTSFHETGGDGNSVCGASVDGSYARSTRAESIRARMRRQEKRLSELVQKQASAELAGADKFKHEMDDVKSNLDKVEQEKYALEQKLEFLKSQQTPEQAAAINVHDVTDHDAFLRDKLNGIQRGFQEQAAKIQAFEAELVSKNAEIEKYKYEIVEKLKRIVELEFDLEMHDIHFTDYFSEQYIVPPNDSDNVGADGVMMSGDASNEELVDENESVVDTTISIMNNGKKLTPKRAQKLIAKLLKDLDHLEATYKKEKLNTVRSTEQLQNENDELKTKILVLEQEQKMAEQLKKNTKGNLMAGLNESGSGYMSIYRLRKRVETLEAKRFLYRKEVTRIKEEMTEMEKESIVRERKHETELSKLQLQLEAVNARVQELEGESSTDQSQLKAIYVDIEQKIQQNYEKVGKMQAVAEIKDKQIDSLKKEVQQLQLTKIASGHGGDKYTKSDIDALKSEKDIAIAGTDSGESHRSIETDAYGEDNKSNLTITNVSAAFVADLQKQLLHAHEQLVKKDQELVIERAKSACMAANLLDRIAELDKEVEKAKRKELQNWSRRSTAGSVQGDAQFDLSYVNRVRPNDDRSTRSRTVAANNDDASVRSSRSLMTVDGETGEKRRKPRKSMASRIPFRFGVSKDQVS